MRRARRRRFTWAWWPCSEGRFRHGQAPTSAAAVPCFTVAYVKSVWVGLTAMVLCAGCGVSRAGNFSTDAAKPSCSEIAARYASAYAQARTCPSSHFTCTAARPAVVLHSNGTVNATGLSHCTLPVAFTESLDPILLDFESAGCQLEGGSCGFSQPLDGGIGCMASDEGGLICATPT